MQPHLQRVFKRAYSMPKGIISLQGNQKHSYNSRKPTNKHLIIQVMTARGRKSVKYVNLYSAQRFDN